MASVLPIKVPLGLFALYYFIVGLWILFDPVSLLELKDIKITDCSETGTGKYTKAGCDLAALFALHMLQCIYVISGCFLGFCFFSAARLGNESLSFLNLCVAISVIYSMIEFFFFLPDANKLLELSSGEMGKTVDTWKIVVWWILAVLMLIFLLASVNFSKLKPNTKVCHATYTCFYMLIVGGMIKWVYMRFFTVDVIERMDLPVDKDLYPLQYEFLLFVIKADFSQILFTIVCFLIGVILSGDLMVSYALDRGVCGMAVVCLAWFFLSDPFYAHLGVKNERNQKIGDGVYYLILAILAWMPVMKMDRFVAKAVADQARATAYKGMNQDEWSDQ